jgi:hypothetical protein
LFLNFRHGLNLNLIARAGNIENFREAA